MQQYAALEGDLNNVDRPAWQSMREFLSGVSKSRALQGFTSDHTAVFIFSFKKPLFARLQHELSGDAAAFGEQIWAATELLDKLAMLTVRSYQQSREEVIRRHQEEMLELSTPVVKLWDGVLGLPMIGTLDSARTQVVMEALLQRIVETGAEIAIIDITGVPTVDTQVAQHLLKTVAAIRLMGADCIILRKLHPGRIAAAAQAARHRPRTRHQQENRRVHPLADGALAYKIARAE